MRTSDPFALRHCAGVNVLQQLAIVGPTGAISDLSKKLLKGVGNDSDKWNNHEEPYFYPWLYNRKQANNY